LENKKNPAQIKGFRRDFGAAGQIRTADLILTNSQIKLFIIFLVVYSRFNSNPFTLWHFLKAVFPLFPILSVAGYVVRTLETLEIPN